MSNQRTIAVVDDDQATLVLVCEMLQAMGFGVHTFTTANALNLARKQQVYTALMLDLSMPDVDGFELIYQLADSSPVEPLLIMSSLPANIIDVAKVICQSLQMPVLGVLAKPFSADELQHALKALV
jgi:DNA-binding response OmpR family regulator